MSSWFWAKETVELNFYIDICNALYYLSNHAPFKAQALEVSEAQPKRPRLEALCIFKHLSTPKYTLGWSDKKEQILLITILIKNTSGHYLKLIHIYIYISIGMWYMLCGWCETWYKIYNLLKTVHKGTSQEQSKVTAISLLFTCSSFLFWRKPVLVIYSQFDHLFYKATASLKPLCK